MLISSGGLSVLKMKKNRFLSTALFCTGFVLNHSVAFAQNAVDSSVVQKEIKNLDAQQAVDFDSSVNAKTSLSQKMVLFEMPKEYECPLFSNSPYSEMLDTLDNMQDQLNTVFPQCDNKKLNDTLTQKSSALRNTVFETKKLVESGQTYKMANKAKFMVDAAYQLQQTLATAAKVQTEACYRSNQQFRNVIFSINETYQSLSPIVMDIVTKNPSLATALGPAIKVLAGMDNLSNGLSLIEQIAKDSVIFDMSDKDNRVNTLKNVCQYMKLYRRLEYMRLSRLGKIQTIFSEYQSRIDNLNQNLVTFKKQHNIDTQMSFADPVYESYTKLKTLLPAELNHIQKAQSDIEIAQDELQNPKISQCEVVKQTIDSNSNKRLIEILNQFANDYGYGDDVFSLIAQINAYKTQFTATAATDISSCVSLGQDILKLNSNLIAEGQKLVASYDQDLAEMNGDPSKIKEKKVEIKEKNKSNVENNFASLKSLLSYASFESGEVEKRAKDMYRYFFAGPDVVKSECDGRTETQKCGWMASAAGRIKAVYQKYRNQGPVYELLLNDQQHFEYSYNALIKARAILATVEYQYALKEFGGQLPQGAEKYQAFLRKSMKYTYELPHMNLQFIPKGSVLHKNLCANMRQILDKYLIASTHVLGSQTLCQMIEPVLKEDNISAKLKQHCLGTMSNFMTESEPSEVQKMVYKLVGVKSGKTVVDDLSSTSLRAITFEKSPKALVDKLVKIYDNFECSEK